MAKCWKILAAILLVLAQNGFAVTNDDSFKPCLRLILGEGFRSMPLIWVTKRLLPGVLKWDNYPITPYEMIVLKQVLISDVERNWQDILKASPTAAAHYQPGDRVRARLKIEKIEQNKSVAVGVRTAEFMLGVSFEVRGWRDDKYVATSILPEDLSVIQMTRLSERFIRAINSITLSISLSQGEQKADFGLFEHFFEAVERAVSRPRMPWLPFGREMELQLEKGQDGWNLTHFSAVSTLGKNMVTLDVTGLAYLSGLIDDQAIISDVIPPEDYDVESREAIVERFLITLREREKELDDQLHEELRRGDGFETYDSLDRTGRVMADADRRLSASRESAKKIRQRIALVRREMQILEGLKFSE